MEGIHMQNANNTQDLFKTLIQATGLPEDLMKKELFSLIEVENKKPSELSMEELRVILAKYLQSVLLEVKELHK